MRNPATRQEWQDAVDAAEGCLHLDAARQHGLVTGGPRVDVGRCTDLIETGRLMGVTPSPGCAVRYVIELMEQQEPSKRPTAAKGGT